MPAQILRNGHSLKLLEMEPSNIPANNSQQRLVPSDSGTPFETAGRSGRRGGVSFRDWVTVAILCFVNLINYMDRFTIAGILEDIKTHYNIGNDRSGLLQTAFVLSYMVFAPLFGYLGDRYSRKYIMAFGITLWSLTTLLGSFANTYDLFITSRALVGIGEASYSTIAPTIISDMFVGQLRSIMLALFYFAIPVGSGLGYIVGSETARATNQWQWGLRVTPIVGCVAVLLVLLVLKDPVRGESEGSNLTPTPWKQDIKQLARNKTFMLTTAGFTCVAFVTGALAWWGPTFIWQGQVLYLGEENVKFSVVSLVFGLVAMIAGVVGVPFGAVVSSFLRPRLPYMDPCICGAGLLLSVPCLTGAAFYASGNFIVCMVFVFFASVSLNWTWAVVSDMSLYVVVPPRRSTAQAFQILVSHAFGDAGSPYLVGVISESIKAHYADSVIATSSLNSTSVIAAALNSTVTTSSRNWDVEFRSLQYALFMTCIVEVIGGAFFLAAAKYVVKDKATVDLANNRSALVHSYADEATNDDSATSKLTH